MHRGESTHNHRAPSSDLVKEILLRLPLTPDGKAAVHNAAISLSFRNILWSAKEYSSAKEIGTNAAIKELGLLVELAGRINNLVLSSMHKTSIAAFDAAKTEDSDVGGRELLTAFAADAWVVVGTAAKAIDRLKKAEFRKGSRGRPTKKRALEIAKRAAATYEDLTGKRPGRVIDGITGNPSGEFFEMLRDIFEAFDIEADAAWALRQALR
jgi:hypothetical protein